jgi:hypothetical protein
MQITFDTTPRHGSYNIDTPGSCSGSEPLVLDMRAVRTRMKPEQSVLQPFQAVLQSLGYATLPPHP